MGDGGEGIVGMIENRGATTIWGLALLCAAIAVPGAAQAGFFEQLFGAPPEPSYYNREPSPEQPYVRHHVRRERPVVSDKPVLQKTTDIMHDPTLRDGDAVMTKTGIKIFVGSRGGVHDEDDFVSLGEARHLKRSERIGLASLDLAHSDSQSGTPAPVIGRSVAHIAPKAQGKDPRQAHRTIRFVGP
jgi:hypothetical protein